VRRQDFPNTADLVHEYNMALVPFVRQLHAMTLLLLQLVHHHGLRDSAIVSAAEAPDPELSDDTLRPRVDEAGRPVPLWDDVGEALSELLHDLMLGRGLLPPDDARRPETVARPRTAVSLGTPHGSSAHSLSQRSIDLQALRARASSSNEVDAAGGGGGESGSPQGARIDAGESAGGAPSMPVSMEQLRSRRRMSVAMLMSVGTDAAADARPPRPLHAALQSAGTVLSTGTDSPQSPATPSGLSMRFASGLPVDARRASGDASPA
jgi:hypothetical protein